jgi:hypothetical protein
MLGNGYGGDQAVCELLAPQTLPEREDEADDACHAALAALDLAAGGDTIPRHLLRAGRTGGARRQHRALTPAPSGWLVTPAPLRPRSSPTTAKARGVDDAQ